MSGLALTWNPEAQEAQLVVAGVELPDAALRTAILLSLFTDRRAEPDDQLDDPAADRRGWWADAVPPVEGDLIGSRLWVLARERRSPETVRRAKDMAEEALAWMVADGVAGSVTVESEASGAVAIALTVTITRPEGSAPRRFDFLWEPA